MGSKCRLLRSVAIIVAVAVLTTYAAILALLYVNQRDMLFVRSRDAAARDPIYAARTITESDGTHVTIWEALQPGAPVIVFFYGNAGTLSDFARVGETFHDEGYGILLASYRGYPGNTGSPSEIGIMDDARAILATLPKDHGPIILWGQSLGTGVAARMASEGRGDALILQSPYTAVADVAARRFRFVPVRWLMRDSFDTFALLPKIRMPVLIMHGTADAVVPFDMGKTLAQSLGGEAAFVPIRGGTHDLYGEDVQPIANAWLRHHRELWPGRARP